MAISEIVRKATTFLLAVFQLLRLATSEVVLFLLLFTFSMLAASGFWKTLLSVTYIYFFPFVLLGYVFIGAS